jgi:hypothetical protein
MTAISLHATPAPAHEDVATAPSALLVSSFFNNIIEIIFLEDAATPPATQFAAVRNALAQSIDADAISHFILGRYSHLQQPAVAGERTADPVSGFLDFAAASVMRAAPHHHDTSGPPVGPELTVLAVTPRSDQVKLVQSELLLANGRKLPLSWEVDESPNGLRIEDVNCLGISIRLMLRSAVAEAAAEHPENAHDLGLLLSAGQPLGQFSDTPTAP